MDPTRLATLYADLADDRRTGSDVGVRLCDACVEVLEVDGAGIMLMSDGEHRGTLGVSNPVMTVVEDLQFTLGEGPCIDAYRSAVPILEPDLGTPTTNRWPAFSGPAVQAGVRAVFGFPLLSQTANLGALDLYLDQPGDLLAEQILDAITMAEVISTTILAIQADAAPGELAASLDATTNHHAIVHQASGMVSVQLDIDVVDALVRIRAEAYVALADTMVKDFDVVEFLSMLSGRCIDLFDAGDAGLMLVDAEGLLQLAASSSHEMRLLELLELQHAEGPCPDACRTGTPVQCADLRDALDRWPTFAPAALTAGFRSATALPMRLRDQTIGALNMLRAEPGPLPEADIAAAQALTDVATIGILHHRAANESSLLSEQLQYALDSRIVIEQAKGAVAQKLNVDTDRAFDALRTYSRSHNRRLVDTATAIVARTLDAAELIS